MKDTTPIYFHSATYAHGHECDTRTADAEFLLSKRQYANLTGRNRGADDVIAYHLRQAFKPGEVTPEEANQIGRELALKLTKGNHAFVVCTHVDKHHVHDLRGLGICHQQAFSRNSGYGISAKYAILRKIALLASIVPNSGQKWLYRKSDYPEYIKESQ